MENFEKLASFFSSKVPLDVKFRVNKLKLLKLVIQKNESLLFDALQLDLNKPAFESYSSELNLIYKEINYFSKKIFSFVRPKKVRTPMSFFYSKSFIYNVPYGVVLIVSPWNYPVLLSLLPLIGAIAAGNCVALKLSEHTPNVNKVLTNILTEVFLTNYVYSDSELSVETINNVIQTKLVQYVFFTGSKQVGQLIAQLCIKHFIPYTLELGGKTPVIVDINTNLKIVAKRIVWAKFYNAGQTCIAPDYLLVHELVKNQLINYIKFYIKKFYFDLYSTQAKIISETHFNRLTNLLKDTVIICGGRFDKQLMLFEPTVIDEPLLTHKIMQEEIFGPILPVISYSKYEQIQEVVHKNPAPLALYIFSRNQQLINDTINTIHFGGGGVNSTLMHIANNKLPFGGIFYSGFGKYHGRYSFDTFSHAKSIIKTSFWPDFSLKYPPYSKLKLWLIKKIF